MCMLKLQVDCWLFHFVVILDFGNDITNHSAVFSECCVEKGVFRVILDGVWELG